MGSRYRETPQQGSRLRGLERRRNACRRQQARRKSDNSNRPVEAVQYEAVPVKRRGLPVAAGKSEAMPDESAMLMSVLEQIPVSVMLCDRELNITFVNRALTEMLVQWEAELRKHFPGFDPHDLVGTGIGRFQKGSGRTPMLAQIRIGTDLLVEIQATAIASPDGECLGRMVVWTEVADQKPADTEVLEILTGLKSAHEEQSRDIAKLSGTIDRLAEAIGRDYEGVAQGEAEISLSSDLRRNLRNRQPVSRRLLVSRAQK